MCISRSMSLRMPVGWAGLIKPLVTTWVGMPNGGERGSPNQVPRDTGWYGWWRGTSAPSCHSSKHVISSMMPSSKLTSVRRGRRYLLRTLCFLSMVIVATRKPCTRSCSGRCSA